MADETIDQYIAGDNNRNAGENYEEINLTIININVVVCNINVFAGEKKMRDFEEEAEFIMRFKFAASPEQRQQVLKIKEHFKLTDLEITLLKRCGALTVKKGKPVTLYSDWIGCLISVILMIYCTFLVPIFSTAVFIRGNNFVLEVLFVSALSAIYFFFCKDLHRLSLKPAKILRENGINFGQTYTLPV